jgi:hypothetical protein
MPFPLFLHFQLRGDDIRFVLLKNILSNNGLQIRKVKKIPSFERGWSFFAKRGEVGGV